MAYGDRVLDDDIYSRFAALTREVAILCCIPRRAVDDEKAAVKLASEMDRSDVDGVVRLMCCFNAQ